MPVFEANVAMLSSTSVDANTEDKESWKSVAISKSCSQVTALRRTNDGYYFDGGEIELNLAIEVDWQEIKNRDDDPEHANEDANVKIWSPVLDDQSGRCQLESKCHCPGKPVYPAEYLLAPNMYNTAHSSSPHSKPKTRINESRRESSECA